MKITLSTGYIYDLSDKDAFCRLKKNLSTMCSRKQFDRLTYIYEQVAAYHNYDGKEPACLFAKEICYLTKAYLEVSMASRLPTDTASSSVTPAEIKSTPAKIIFTSIFASLPPDETKKGVIVSPKKSSPRSNKTAYEKNLTAALLMPEKTKVEDNPVESLKRARDLLIEHAARRVDLAFYLMVAYYKTRIVLNIDETTSQHGMGSESTIKTHACHSALISTVEELFRLKLGTPYDERSSRSKAEALVKPYLAAGSHFKETLSMTVELPQGVNYYDIKLEGKIGEKGRSITRSLLLEILNQVSLGELTPFQGLKKFFISLKKFFIELEKSGYLTSSTKTSPAELKSIAHAAQIHGTFKNRCSVFDYEGETHAYVVPEYPASLLRLKPEDFARVSDGITPEKEIEAIFESYYNQLKEEMGTAPLEVKIEKKPMAGAGAS